MKNSNDTIRIGLHMVNYIYKYQAVQFQHAEIYWPQHDRPVTCVIAQQCSSTTFFSLRFHSLQKNLDTHLNNNVLFWTLFTLLKLRSLKIRTLGTVCTHCMRQSHIPQSVYKQNAIAPLLLVFRAPGSLYICGSRRHVLLVLFYSQDTVQRYILLQNTFGSNFRLFGHLALRRTTFRHEMCEGRIWYENRERRDTSSNDSTKANIQGVSGGIVNILGGGSLDYSK